VNKLINTFTTLLLAARYSFSFCWRNCRKETLGRLITAVMTTLLMYLTMQATGLVFNAVQKSMQKKFDASIGGIAHSGIFVPLVFILSILLFGVVLSRFTWYFRSQWRHSLHFANQRELNNHRATLDVARFRSKEYDDLSKRIGELPTSWNTRIDFSDEMFNLFTTLISFFLFGSSLIWYQPVYAVILLVTAIPMMVSDFKMMSSWWNLFQELVPQHKKRYVLEKPYKGVTAFVQALMFNQMPALSKEIDINVGGVVGAFNKLRRMTVAREILTRLLAVGGLCGILVHAVWMTMTHAGHIGTLTIIITAARTFQGNLESMVSLVAEQWNSAKGVILIENDFLGMKPLLKTENAVVPKFDSAPQIRFDRVCFAYPDSDMLALKDVSFSIEPGSKVAIVGKSGNGKSTIQALLMRHYDPTSGAVYAGDINLQNIEPNVWSETASALTQEYTVLERRISEEIASSRLGSPIDLEVVATSARFANFDEVVSEDPKGYESQIGVDFGGRDFSGGERQRLALARVHYRGTPILILDEPDAKLDPESAQKVIDRVFALKGITVIIITHHVSRAERCDKVIVMGKAEVAEEGSHQELIARGGIYASMFGQDKKRLGSESSELE